MKLSKHILAGALLTASATITSAATENFYLYHNNSIIFATEASAVDSIAWEENSSRVSLYNAVGQLLFTSGVDAVDSLSSVCHTPVADILDVVFNDDGTATDISPMKNTIETFNTEGKLSVYYNEEFGRNAAHFDNGWASRPAKGYYKVSYKGNDTFKKALEDGHTLECVVMADVVNNSEAKFFSSHAAGGTGLMICNKDGGRQFNSFTFLPNVTENGGSTWRWANSNVQPTPKQFYHLVAVYDKNAAKAKIYVDGELKATTDAKGDYRHPDGGTSEASHWFGIGCDPGGDVGEQSWQGDVVLARIYDNALTDYDARALYEALTQHEEDPEPGPEPSEIEVPTASILDVVFNADGTATDISPMANNVQTIASDKLYTYYSPAFGRYVAHFDNGFAQLASGYYRIDYKDNAEFKAALEDGHSLECVVMADCEGSLSCPEAKFFSSHGGGGTGLMIANGDNANRAYNMTFLPHVGGEWRWGNSRMVPVGHQFYHIVAIWNKDEGKAEIYVNGTLRNTVNAAGDYRHPNDVKLHWFGIGCDPGIRDGNAVGEQAWQGDVALARIYDHPLTAEEATNLWTVIKDKIEYVEPELVTEARVYNLPVIAGKTFPVYGKGFLEGDVIEMTAAGNTSVSVTSKLTDRGVVLSLPADIVSGLYRITLHRGEQQQTLGNARIEVVESLPAGAEIIAHRGHWTADGAVQNSRASLQAAMDIEAYGSETDVWVTTDNHLMINHDRTFGGVTICESTYDRCKDLTLGNGEKMPQLQDFLTMVKEATDCPTRLVIEVKDHGTQELDNRAAEQTVKAVADAGMTGDEKIKYISFSRDACCKIIALEPEAEVAFICSNASAAMTPAQLHAAGYHGFDYEMGLLRNNLSWIQEAHDLGMIVNVWTVNSASDIIEFMKDGVDFVTTNDPETALDIKAHFDTCRD